MLSEQEQSAIMRSLENVLADAKFAGSPQMSAFLRYVVVEALEGNADRIKAYTVAVDALGKNDSFDPQNDPSVRVLAKRLRTALTQFYERTDNHEKIIEIRAGSYKPIFSDPVKADGETQGSVQTGFDNAVSYELDTSSAVSDSNLQSDEEINRSAINETKDKSPAPLMTLTQAEIPSAAHSQITDTITPNGEGNVFKLSTVNKIKNKLYKRANYYHAFKRVLVRKKISGAFLFLALLTVFWRVSFDNEQAIAIDQAASPVEDQYVLQLASSNAANRLRQRPNIPTVIVRTKNREDKLSQSLVSSLVHVLSKFNHIQVLNTTHEYELMEKWPEDYELVLDALTMNDSRKITINLVNAASGRIVFSDELKISGGFDAGLAESNIEAVNLTAAKIVQKEGPLLVNYKSQAKYSEAMACLFSIEKTIYKADIDDRCEALINKGSLGEPLSSALKAELHLSRYLLESGNTKKEVLADALTAVKLNLDLAPHSADAHALAMRIYHLRGDHDNALIHGRRAVGINELDSENIHEYSLLLAELNQTEDAEKMRNKARILSAGSSDISL